jgi:hypothetical protein
MNALARSPRSYYRRLSQHFITAAAGLYAGPASPLFQTKRHALIKDTSNYILGRYFTVMSSQVGECAPVVQTLASISTTQTTTGSSSAVTYNTPATVMTSTSAASDASEPSKLSKNQQKKLLRKRQFEASRPAWKAAKKEKEKARKQRKREAAAAQNALKRKLPEDGQEMGSLAETKRVKTQTIVEDIALLMDCGFDDLMTDKVCSLAISLAGST